MLVKGGDYRLDAVVGGEVVRRQGGEVRVLGLQPGRSTTELAARVRKEGALGTQDRLLRWPRGAQG